MKTNRLVCTCTLAYVLFMLPCISLCFHDDSIAKFINDLVKFNRKYSPPYKLIAFFCWGQTNTANFLKLLSKNSVFASAFSSADDWVEGSEVVNNDEFLMFVVDMSCDRSQQLILQANSTGLLNPPSRWLLLWPQQYNSMSENDTLECRLSIYPIENFLPDEWASLLNSLGVHVSTEVMIGKQVGIDDFILVDVYKRSKHVDADFIIMACWDEMNGIYWPGDIVVARRRRNLRGITMRVVAVLTDNSTLEHMTDLVNIHIDSMTRVTHFLVTHANEQMNTSMKKFYVSTWGYLVNGTWDGMVGHLMRDEADIAGTGTVLVPERVDVVQYLMMTTPTRLGFVFREPPLSYTSNIFILPFNKGVWFCIVVTLTACGFLLYVAFKWEKSQTQEQFFEVTWSDTVMFIMGAVTEQGSSLQLNKFSGRIISIFLFVFVIFVITSYSASIVAILQSTSDSIKTLKDLMDSGLILAAHDTVYNRYFIKAVNDPLRRAVYEQKIAPKRKPANFYTLHEGVEKMRKGRFAFHIELGAGFKVISERFLEHEKCSLKTITYLPIIDTYTIIQKNSPYKEIISVAYHKMLERGIQRRAYNRYYTKKPQCTSKGSNFVEVGLEEFYPALLVLVYGLTCSLFVLISESLFYRRSGDYKKPDSNC